MWTVAGNKILSKLSTFSTTNRGGFSGKQVFNENKENDCFYLAVQSVIANANSYAAWYDKGYRKKGTMPEACVIVFPLIVVEGSLFEAYFNEETKEISIEPTDHVRCHWRGSPANKFISTVDVVSLDYLEKFICKRAKETKFIFEICKKSLEEIEVFQKTGLVDSVNVTDGSRGFRGVPSLLSEFFSIKRKKHLKMKWVECFSKQTYKISKRLT